MDITAVGKTTYYIYGRQSYPQPLEFVKTVAVADVSELPRNGELWVELVAFPETAVIQVIPRDREDERDHGSDS